MKPIIFLSLCILLSSCRENTSKTIINKDNQTTSEKKYLKPFDTLKVKKEIKELIVKTLTWTDSDNSIDLLPMKGDSSDVCVGFELNKHKRNLNRLKETDFFTDEFIENYNQIILTLDKDVRNNDYDKFWINEIPPFVFASGVSPWCECQDNLPWKIIELDVFTINNNQGELAWYWGKTNQDINSNWNEFKYKFRVSKEDSKWKISYLQGFDFKQVTNKNKNDSLTTPIK